MCLQRIQFHSRQRDEAVADQLQSILGEPKAIAVIAAREHSIGNELIPRPASISFGKDKRFILNLRLHEAKCVDEVKFSRSPHADLCIDVHLDER